MPGITLRIRTQPVRKALCVAIKYSHLRDRGFELAHAHDDVRHVQNLLTKHFGYSEQDITVLRDSDDPLQPRPTRENIIQAMRDLVAGALPGDHLLCHVSGHGSQIPNLDHTEKDEMDEVFWPVDVNIKNDGSVENHIKDDEIKNILVDGIMPGVNLVLLFDCCHSGTIADLPHSHTDHMRHTRPRKEAQTSAPAQLTRNVVCWSACRDAQNTYNPATSGGLFIKYLTKCISENTSQTHQQLLHKTTEKLQGLLRAYNERLKNSGDLCRIIPSIPKPELSSLCYLPQLFDVPIDAVFGKRTA
ncbi:caspase domain-containing protein [Cytidiella melzeri]|nr:caspase domain-containing protein [Cytidiella melzeri]